MIDPKLDPKALSLGELRALPQSDFNGCAVYFLWKDEELLYVGAALHVTDRICQQARYRDFPHTQNNYWRPRVPFNRYTFLPCEKDERNDIEAALILKFDPPYNETTSAGDPG